MSGDVAVVSMSSVVQRSDQQVSCDIDDETVLMHLESGRYFGYDAVGTRVWALLSEPRSVSGLCAQLVSEYRDVDLDQCTRDVLAFLKELVDEGLATCDTPDAQPTR